MFLLFSILSFLDKFAMDSIWNCAFGLDVNCQNENENLFLKNVLRHFHNVAEFKLLHLINCMTLIFFSQYLVGNELLCIPYRNQARPFSLTTFLRWPLVYAKMNKSIFSIGKLFLLHKNLSVNKVSTFYTKIRRKVTWKPQEHGKYDFS